MPTTRQKKLAKAIVENLTSPKPKNKKDLLVSVGYDVITAEAQPGRTIDQKGVKEELIALGFSLDEADRTVASLLKGGKKEETKIKAAQEIYKRLGGYAPDKTINLNIEQQMMSNEDITKLAEVLNKQLKDGSNA